MPPEVAFGVPCDIVISAAHDKHVFDRWRLRDGFVNGWLEGEWFASAIAPVRGNYCHRLGIFDSATQCLSTKPTKDHRVRGANAGTREHCHGRLGNHRHIYGDAIAGFDA